MTNFFPQCEERGEDSGDYPLAQNQYMQEKHLGPVFALARIQENIFEEVFPEYCAKFLEEFIRCEYMPRLYSHPREYRKIFLANYLCIGFVPGGNSLKSVLKMF